MEILFTALGGVVGVLCRYAVMNAGWWDNERYLYTGAINLTGCLVIGILWAVFRHYGTSALWQSLAITGLLGGFTTYSAFALDAVKLTEAGMAMRAAGYVAVTVIGGIACCGLGLWGTDRILKTFV